MRFIIENANPQHIKQLKHHIQQQPDFKFLGIKNVCTKIEWVQIGGNGIERVDELRPVISFEFPERSDELMPLITSVFEGSGLIISSPDLPGFRFEVA